MDIQFSGSDGQLRAKVTGEGGAGVSGAIVTVTCRNQDGAAPFLTDQTMTEMGSTGVYQCTISHSLIPPAGSSYRATVTALKDGWQRQATATIPVKVDTT